MIAFGACVGSQEKYRTFAVPGIREVAEPDSVVAEVTTDSSIFTAYNEVLDALAGRDDLEALVLLHEDTEIVDPEFCAKVRRRLADPAVAIAGPIGAAEVASLRWWEGRGRGRVRETRGLIDFGGPLPADVDVLDGWWPPLRDALSRPDRRAAVAFPDTIDGAMRHDFAAWCFAVSRAALEEFAVAPGEFFDPQLVVWYQDTDLLQRLRLAGRPPEHVPASRIRHGLSETVASEDPALREWIHAEIARDTEAFVAKWPGVPVPPAALQIRDAALAAGDDLRQATAVAR